MLVYRNGRLYSYRKEWRDGKSRSIYRASGDVAVLIEELDRIEAEERREEAEAKRAAEEQERLFYEMTDAMADAAIAPIVAIGNAVMGRAGFHKHNRGEWRRTKGWEMGTDLAIGEMTAEEAKAAGKFGEWSDTNFNLAIKDDKTALQRLSRAYANDPIGYIKAARFGMQDAIEATLAGTAFKDQEYIIELAQKDAHKMRIELEGDNPTAIVKALAGAASICWLDWIMIMAPRNNNLNANLERRRTRAHRRYLSTLKLLAQVQQLAKPAEPSMVVNNTTSGPQKNVVVLGGKPSN